MEENKTEEPTKQPIEDIKPPLPDAASTGAEFSEDLGPQPFPPKELSGVKQENSSPNTEKQPIVSPPEQEDTTEPSNEVEAEASDTQDSSSEPQSASSTPQEPISSPPEATASPTSTPTPVNSKDHGTHRSVPKKSRPGLAIFIAFVGLSLCGFVVYAYLATN